MNIDKITKQILSLADEKGTVIIAIDGFCASGKTTLAAEISKKLDCNIFHADDFFLRPEQRTAERLCETGGNMDRERLLSEVIIPIRKGEPFTFRPFLCHSQTMGEETAVTPKRINIIEGSYSCHPLLSENYDLKIMLTISQREQRERILKRNPDKAEAFFSKWIPLENEYFKSLGISYDDE